MEERRAKRLCFGCNNKLFKAHTCPKTRLFSLENIRDVNKDPKQEFEEDFEPPSMIQKGSREG
jgi:hypothetical protein